jgi:hypothetical protein
MEFVNLVLLDGLSERMAGENGFPRRKRLEHGRASRGALARPVKRADDASLRTVTREALDVARYVSDMTAQLEAMATAARLDLLAYFLGMAKAESEMFVRTSALTKAELRDDQSSEAGPEDG